jgi:hypothetical protein
MLMPFAMPGVASYAPTAWPFCYGTNSENLMPNKNFTYHVILFIKRASCAFIFYLASNPLGVYRFDLLRVKFKPAHNKGLAFAKNKMLADSLFTSRCSV